jgi:hypothetical protein
MRMISKPCLQARNWVLFTVQRDTGLLPAEVGHQVSKEMLR